MSKEKKKKKKKVNPVFFICPESMAMQTVHHCKKCAVYKDGSCKVPEEEIARAQEG